MGAANTLHTCYTPRTALSPSQTRPSISSRLFTPIPAAEFGVLAGGSVPLVLVLGPVKVVLAFGFVEPMVQVVVPDPDTELEVGVAANEKEDE